MIAATPHVHASQLKLLLSDIAQVSDLEDRAVTGVTTDSRRVTRGDVFIAIPGSADDGRDYIDSAVQQGAIAVVCEGTGFSARPCSVPVYAVMNLRARLGRLANQFFGIPSERLRVVGVTGTNGKTTYTHLMAQALHKLGLRCGMIGTPGVGFLGHLTATPLTTPDVITLHGMLAQLAQAGAEFVCLEVSSHALDQARVSGVTFDTAVFTNLSHDHLDYHGDMERYARAKSQLFKIARLQHAVINVDADLGAELADNTTAESVWTYGLASHADVYPDACDLRLDGMAMHVATPRGNIVVASRLIGRVNVPNVLAVVATLLAFGHDPATVQSAVNDLVPVPGRMELFNAPTFPAVVVDYAHTPDALEKALESLREHCRCRLWCVFGCGGDRDQEKRPQMGRIAERHADRVILTDDNPRHEDPGSIVAAIQSGMQHPSTVIHGRASAIHWAITSAQATDIVLIAGKGHETKQLVGDRIIPLDDRALVIEALSQKA